MSNKENLIFVISVLPVMCFVAFAGYESGRRDGYRQGQIDALSGHASIELRDQPDGSRAWVEKNKP